MTVRRRICCYPLVLSFDHLHQTYESICIVVRPDRIITQVLHDQSDQEVRAARPKGPVTKAERRKRQLNDYRTSKVQLKKRYIQALKSEKVSKRELKEVLHEVMELCEYFTNETDRSDALDTVDADQIYLDMRNMAACIDDAVDSATGADAEVESFIVEAEDC